VWREEGSAATTWRVGSRLRRDACRLGAGGIRVIPNPHERPTVSVEEAGKWRPRGAGGGQRRCPGPRRARRLARPPLRPAVQSGPLAPDARCPRRAGNRGGGRGGARRRAHRPGPTEPARGPLARHRRPRPHSRPGRRHLGQRELAGLCRRPPGEHLSTSQRVAVPPSAGIFRPDASVDAPRPGNSTRRPKAPTSGHNVVTDAGGSCTA